MAGTISSVAGTRDRLAGLVIRMTAKPALRDAAIGKPVEWESHMFEFDDDLDRFLAEDINSVLISQIVRSFDSIVSVPLPSIFFEIAERGADAALGRAGMRASRI